MNADSTKQRGLKEKVEEIGLTASGKEITMKDHDGKARSKVCKIREDVIKRIAMHFSPALMVGKTRSIICGS